jgi:hypothetical protein
MNDERMISVSMWTSMIATSRHHRVIEASGNRFAEARAQRNSLR